MSSLLIQMNTCRLFGVNSISYKKPSYCWLYRWERIPMKCDKREWFSFKKTNEIKYRLPHVGHFIKVSICSGHNRHSVYLPGKLLVLGIHYATSPLCFFNKSALNVLLDPFEKCDRNWSNKLSPRKGKFSLRWFRYVISFILSDN